MPKPTNSGSRGDSAVGVLQRALAQLVQLIRDAARDERFSEIAALGRCAEGIRALLAMVAAETVSGAAGGAGESSDRAEVKPGSVQARAKSRPQYPRYVRQGSRLVKIGWSKRDASEYEHKAPKEAVEAVAAAVSGQTKRQFAIDELVPIKDGNGTDVPSYQVYLVVGWLRQLEAVERMGNDGYSANRDKLKSGLVERAWESLPVG